MSAHAKFSPSGAHRWMLCNGSMALERAYPRGSSKYADEGTAAHTVSSDCLLSEQDAVAHLGRVVVVEQKDDEGKILSSRSFTVDESMALNVQIYLDLVRSYVAQGYTLLVEQRLEFSKAIGIPNQFGTGDAILISEDGTHVIVIDLKFGAGEIVKAAVLLPDGVTWKLNKQMMSYALGALETLGGLCGDFKTIEMIVCQPRTIPANIDKSPVVPIEEVVKHGKKMFSASIGCTVAMERHSEGLDIMEFLNPDPDTCRWCAAKADCPALTAKVAKEVFDDFEALDDSNGILLGTKRPRPPLAERLGTAFGALDLIGQWMKSVIEEVHRQVAGGMEVIGPDGLPLKFIAGKKGDRAWKDKAAAEALLCGLVSPDKVYKPQEIVTPSVANGYFKAKAKAAIWEEQFKPMITQKPGAPKLALGSDPADPYVASADAGEFTDLDDPSA